jgi:hypothetical protein
MSLIHAIDVQVGDYIGDNEITHKEIEEGWVELWQDNQFVPKCYRPKDTVYIR